MVSVRFGAPGYLSSFYSAYCLSSVGALTSIRIHNYLSPGQSGIPMRAADHKLTRRVDVIGNLFIEQGLNAFWKLLLYAGDQDANDILLDLGQHLCIILHKWIVLGRNYDRIDTLWQVVIGIFYGHLCLCIGSQIGNFIVLPSQY